MIRRCGTASRLGSARARRPPKGKTHKGPSDARTTKLVRGQRTFSTVPRMYSTAQNLSGAGFAKNLWEPVYQHCGPQYSATLW
eukprot:537974-Amphidinium_carterae.2